MARDKFSIQPMMQFMLFFRPIGTLVLLAILLSVIQNPRLELDDMGYLGVLVLAGYAVYEISRLIKWHNFSVALDENQITIGDAALTWDQIRAAKAESAMQFDTFITLESTDGKVYKIPGAIQESAFILSKIQKHFPSIKLMQ